MLGIFLLLSYSTAQSSGIPEDGNLPPSSPSITLVTSKSEILIGESIQLRVDALDDSGTITDVTNDPNTSFDLSNIGLGMVDVTSEGLVTGVSRGTAIVSASFFVAADSSTSNSIEIHVRLPDDADDDGMTDAFEDLHGLDKNDPADAELDSDGDGLSNLEEFEKGSDPNSTDTDGDGFSDSEEVSLEMDPATPDEFLAIPGHLLLNQNCTVSVLNRTAQVNPDGSFNIINLPASNGPFRARAVCNNQGRNLFGQSDFLVDDPSGIINIGTIKFFEEAPAPFGFDKLLIDAVHLYQKRHEMISQLIAKIIRETL